MKTAKANYNIRVYNIRVIIIFIITFIINSSFAPSLAFGAAKKTKPVPIQSSLVVDGVTGKILHSKNARAKIFPASLTKVMTLYMIFDALKAGKLSMQQKLYISNNAAAAQPSKLYLKPGDTITVRDTILGLIVKSANDAARVAAENIAGSENRFAKLMNIKAKKLGMNNTTFTNASGWHDHRQKTTALDLAKLSLAIKRDFPEYYHFFKETSFNFNGRHIKGHNTLTAKYKGAEGLKTGFTNFSGRNLITTATRGKKSLVGIVTGSKSSAERDLKMIALLDRHFGIEKKTIK